MSNDFGDFEVLTHGHFLIGQSILAVSEPSLTDINTKRLSHWQRDHSNWVGKIEGGLSS